MALRGEQGHWVADSPSDLENWTVLAKEPWKEGVERWHCRQTSLDGQATFVLVYVGVDDGGGR